MKYFACDITSSETLKILNESILLSCVPNSWCHRKFGRVFLGPIGPIPLAILLSGPNILIDSVPPLPQNIKSASTFCLPCVDLVCLSVFNVVFYKFISQILLSRWLFLAKGNFLASLGIRVKTPLQVCI